MSTEKQFILDPNEETVDTFWKKITFQKPTDDAHTEHAIRCKFEILSQPELDDLTLDDNGDPRRDGNFAVLERAWVDAEISTRDSEGKVVAADFGAAKSAMMKKPYFVTAAATQYIRTVYGVGTTGRKRKN